MEFGDPDQVIFHYSYTRNSKELEIQLKSCNSNDIHKLVDVNGSNPLHILYSKVCLSEKCQLEAAKCTKLLLKAGVDVNLRNKGGDVPLFLALKNNWIQAAQELVLNGAADLTVSLPSNELLATYLANTSPDLFYELLNQDVKPDIGSDGSVDKLRVDFTNVIQYPNASPGLEPIKKIRYDETAFLQSIAVSARGTKIFKHPVLLLFLGLKYSKLQTSIVMSFFWHVLTIALYTVYIYLVYVVSCPYDGTQKPEQDEFGSTIEPPAVCKISPTLKAISGILTGVWVLMLGTEISIFITRGRRSYFSKRTIPWYTFYILMPITLWPSIGDDDEYIFKWRYPLAAANIFLIWALCIIHFAKIQKLAIIFEMFTKVTLKVFFLALFFIPLFIGFTISFFILDANNIDSPYSLTTLFSMMIGDTSYDELFQEERSSSTVYEILSNLLYLMFLLLMSVVFVNFILALTISDIKELWVECEKSRTKNQIQLMFMYDRLRVSKLKLFTEDQIRGNRFEYQLDLTNPPEFIHKRIIDGLKELVYKNEGCGHLPLRDFNTGSSASIRQLIPRASIHSGKRNSVSDINNKGNDAKRKSSQAFENAGILDEDRIIYEALKILERRLNISAGAAQS